MIKLIKILFLVFIFLFSIIWTYENTDKIDSIKGKIKKIIKKEPKVSETIINENIIDSFNVEANGYDIEINKIIDFKEKTAFVLYEVKENFFDVRNIKIFLQNGFLISADKFNKLTLNKNYTLEFNGGIKSVFFYNSEVYGLVTSNKNDCYYVSIVNLNTGDELFNSDCLPSINDEDVIDLSGSGSSIIDEDDYVLISIGTPTTNSTNIELLAQNKVSYFGKILKIKKSELIINNKLKPEIFSIGHRNPQGMTKFDSDYFSVEHGPKGGDELNKIIESKNYGWPIVSFGTKYLYDENGLSYNKDHETQGFEPPLYAFIPSVGISSLNNCPSVLKNYYKKNCLIALSLNGNNLQQGNSLIIFLLNNKKDAVQSVEKIFIKSNYALRHFLTDKKNNIFEDEDGSIFISVDSKGIYRFKFKNLR